jgi:hypothetical protein
VRNKKACASNNKLQAQKNLALGEVLRVGARLKSSNYLLLTK